MKGRTENDECDDLVTFAGISYKTALIGVTNKGQAVYDFDKMVEWLVSTEGMEPDEAAEWIECNTLSALNCAGEKAPVILFPF